MVVCSCSQFIVILVEYSLAQAYLICFYSSYSSWLFGLFSLGDYYE